MSDELTEEQEREARELFRTGMIQNALRDEENVDSRQLALFKKNGFLDRAQPKSLPDPILAALDPEDDSRRVCNLPGPVLFVEEAEGKATAVPVVDAFLDESERVRSAVLTYVEHLVAQNDSLVSASSRESLRLNRDALVGSDPKAWRHAALSVSDQLRDDFLFNIAGMRQSLSMRYEEGCRDYSLSLLKPTIGCVNAIPLKIVSPTQQKGEIVGWLQSCVGESGSLEEALDSYFRFCGHLPLATEMSMGRVLLDWLEVHEDEDNVWRRLWKWATGTGSPIARYHACQALVGNPQLVSEDNASTLWQEIANVVTINESPEGSAQPWSEAWRLRCELARHYCHYIETRLHEAEGERTASVSWWLSDQVSALFGRSPEYIRSIRENVIAPQAELSSQLWQLAHPAVQPSALRYGTLFVGSVWSLSLLSEIGQKLQDLYPERVNVDDRKAIGEAVSAGILYGSLSRPSEDEGVFAFEHGVIPMARAWSDLPENESTREMNTAFMHAMSAISSTGAFPEALGRLAQGPEADAMLVSRVLMVMAYTGRAPVDAVWNRLSDESWREQVLLFTKEGPLGVFFDALSEIQSHCQNQGQACDQWVYELPHMFALACEKASDNDERRELLFAMVLLSCMYTDTVSALQRILRGKHRAEMSEQVEHWRERLKYACKVAPSTLAARIRPILASLHV